MKPSKKQYEKSLKLIKQYEEKEKVLLGFLKEFRESKVVEKYFTVNEETAEDILAQIDVLISKGIDINEIINVLLSKSYIHHIKNIHMKYILNVEDKLKILIKYLLNKKVFVDYSFINNRDLDRYLELFIYLLKEPKILKFVNVKTIIRIRDYIGSNLPCKSQSRYLHVYIVLIRNVDKSLLLKMGNKFYHEYEAFKLCYEHA